MTSTSGDPFLVGEVNSDKYPDRKYRFRIIDCRKIPVERRVKNVEFMIYIHDADLNVKETLTSIPKVLEKIITENKINGFKVKAFITESSWDVFSSAELQEQNIKYKRLLFAWDNDDKHVLEIKIAETEGDKRV